MGLHQEQLDGNATDSDADDDLISYKSHSSSSSSSSSVSFDSSSSSASTDHGDNDNDDDNLESARYPEDKTTTTSRIPGPPNSTNASGIVSASPPMSSSASHFLSPPPRVSNRMDTPLSQGLPYRPRSRSTSSFSSPLAFRHRQHDLNHISPLPSTVVGTVESSASTTTRDHAVSLTSSSSSMSAVRRNSTTFQEHPQDVTGYPDIRPGSRPRSNTRRNNATPIRNVTPVLGPVNRATLAASEALQQGHEHDLQGEMRGAVTGTGTTAPAASRSGSHGRSSHPRSRPHVMPTSSPRLVGLGANLAVGTVLPSSSSSLSVLQERSRRGGNHAMGGRSHLDAANQPRSCKQGPGHRKVRRWNNDLFIGIAKDISCSHMKNPQRGARIANIYAEAEMHKARYTMPYAPRHRWTVFRALMEGSHVHSGSGSGSSSIGNHGAGGGGGVPSWEEEEEGDWDPPQVLKDRARFLSDPEHLARVRDRFLEGESGAVSSGGGCGSSPSAAAVARQKRWQEELFQNGAWMVKWNVDKRLVSIVTRTCRGPGFTQKVVDAFEHVLVKNMSGMTASGGGGGSSTEEEERRGIPPNFDDVWEKVLVQKPFVTRKVVKHSTPTSSSNQESEKIGVTTVRMIFSDLEDGSRAAFHRLLLHAVCQFHGLEASSNTTSKGQKMLTVTGTCKGSHLRFLDFVPFMEEEEEEVSDPMTTKHEKDSTTAATTTASSCQNGLVKAMSTLQVQ